MKWIPGRRLRRAAAITVGAVVALNGLSAYAAANPWATELLWKPDDRTGQLEAAVGGAWTDTAHVQGQFVAPTTRDQVVVLVHGFGDDYNSPAVVAAAGWLVEDGYGVLAIDLGYLHGRHRYTGGTREAHDITNAVTWLTDQGHTVAGLWGFSAGAHAALIAASTDTRIPKVVADSAFADGTTQIRRIASRTWHLPKAMFPLIGPGVRVFSGDKPANIARLPWPGTPVLVIHGAADTAVPLADADTICRVVGCKPEVFQDAEHTKAYETEPARYRRLAQTFLENN